MILPLILASVVIYPWWKVDILSSEYLRQQIVHPYATPPTGRLKLIYGRKWTYLPCTSVTRARLGKTEAELDKEINLPETSELVIYNSRRNIDARPRKLNLLAKQIRYLPLSEAIKQMEFSVRQAARNIKEVLVETQEKAQKEHSVVDLSTLWVAESYVGRGFIEKNMIRHSRGRFGAGRKAFTHYFVVVKEGLPKPKQQRRSSEEKTHFERHAEYKPKILDSHSWY